jgi:transcriptional regulator with XRE-family HTH domain
MFMPRTDKSFHQLPGNVTSTLHQLGRAIRVARLRRRQSAQDFASRLGVTLPTLRKLERGDPGVALATFVSAFWLIDMLDRLRDLAKPESDVLGNMLESSRLPQRVRRSRDDDLDRR